MSKLIINDTEHPWDEEIEIFDEDKGFYIEIHTKSDNNYDDVIVCRNCTEFHHKYNTKFNEEFGEEYGYTPEEVEETNPMSSAFESDIHGTGRTIRLTLVDKIVVSKADKIYESYYGD